MTVTRRASWLSVALGLGCVDGSEIDSEIDSSADADSSVFEATGEADQGPLVELGERDAWTELGPTDDPLADHRPTEVDCPVGAWVAELGQLEVQTGVCNYLALAQPSRVALEPGDVVTVDLWHDALDSAAPALGHVAVLLGDRLVGEAEVEIPSDAAVLRFEWAADQVVPANTPVILHLHNHGYNSWTFIEIEARTPG